MFGLTHNTIFVSQVITEKIRGDEVSAAVLADWRFAAMVLDRNGVSFSAYSNH